MSLGSKIERHDIKSLCSWTLTIFAVNRRNKLKVSKL
jgi:hypothetical protein